MAPFSSLLVFLHFCLLRLLKLLSLFPQLLFALSFSFFSLEFLIFIPLLLSSAVPIRLSSFFLFCKFLHQFLQILPHFCCFNPIFLVHKLGFIWIYHGLLFLFLNFYPGFFSLFSSFFISFSSSSLFSSSWHFSPFLLFCFSFFFSLFFHFRSSVLFSYSSVFFFIFFLHILPHICCFNFNPVFLIH